MIVTDKKIRIYDDTGVGDPFIVSGLIYEDNKHLLCYVKREYGKSQEEFKVMIRKDTREVFSDCGTFDTYVSENY